MNRKILLSFVSIPIMAMALASQSKAQVLSPTSTSTSTSSSNASAGSSSNSGSRSQVGNTAAQITLSQPSSVYSTQPTDVTVRSAPQVYVPGIITGNVCALGASAGASFIGTGFAVGGSWESEQCERRQTAALLHNAGYQQAARELMCDKREVYDSMKRAGTPCLVRPAWEPVGAPPPTMVQQTAPVPIVTPAPVPVVQKSYPRCNARLGIVDNCVS